MRQVLGDATFIQLVRDERAELMSRITDPVDREARSLGVEVVDVKIRRADLPEANSQAIYERMQTERQREATQIRAHGEQQARRIRAEADRDGDGHRRRGADSESEQTRGDGEAERNEIFAKAFNADPEFFAFYRSMQAYQAGLGGTDTRWVISPDSEFFRFFNDSDALAAPQQVRPEPPAAHRRRRPRLPPDAAASPTRRRPRPTGARDGAGGAASGGSGHGKRGRRSRAGGRRSGSGDRRRRHDRVRAAGRRRSSDFQPSPFRPNSILSVLYRISTAARRCARWPLPRRLAHGRIRTTRDSSLAA